jgi:hypothetical protein
MHEADDLLRDGNVECLCEPLEPPSSWTYAPWPDEPMEVPC